jgi:nucleotide-binding universal stress UspA family protein
MYQRILVPLDGSSLAEQALPHALAQARQFGAELVLLKVLGPLPESIRGSRTSIQMAKEQSADLALEYLKQVAAELREQAPEVEIEVATVEGKPYVEIVGYAAEQEVDLIVMSTRGHSGFSRWLLGAVTDRVVRGATVPLLLVRVRDEDSS